MTGALERPLPPLNDAEGERIPAGLSGVVDAHVHLFPDELYASIWEWFRRHGWPIRYRLTAPQVVEFLLGRGIRHVVGLQYAHKPGVARRLNRFMAGLCRQYPQLTGLASVFPGEEGAAEILQEAFSEGLSGVKLHAHVQCFDMDSPGMHAVYEAAGGGKAPCHARGPRAQEPGLRLRPLRALQRRAARAGSAAVPRAAGLRAPPGGG